MPRWSPRWFAQAPNVQLTLQSTLHFATHAAWLYPFKGFIHFTRHRHLHPLLTSRLLTTTLLSLFVTFTLFFWTYLPQALFLSLFHRPASAAFLNAVFLVLSESAAVTALLFEAFFVDETLVDCFDAVLVERGFEEEVRTHRPVDVAVVSGNGNGGMVIATPLQRLGRPTHKSTYAPFSLRQIVEFVVLLPLNLIPYVGVPAFLWLTGYRAGPLHHHRLFKLKEMTGQERKAWIKRRRSGYTTFGVAGLVLQLVPVLSMVFLVTTACGSALWAADMLEMERREGGEEGDGLGGRGRGIGRGVVVWDEYADDDAEEDASLLA